MDPQVNPELCSLRLRQRLQGDATIIASIQDTIILMRNTLKIQETLLLNYESYSKDFYRARGDFDKSVPDRARVEIRNPSVSTADSVPVITV